jgi:DNA mismatch endonuclease (patch repair protein)
MPPSSSVRKGDVLAGAVRERSSQITPEVRSQMMRSIRKANTGPERSVRRLLTKLGFRYRLHDKGLPGSPDIVLRRQRKVVFVHGCFWHQHDGCRLAKRPSARLEYWLPKFARNRQRDRNAISALKSLGWESLVVWECELEDEWKVSQKLRCFLCDRFGRAMT